MREALRPFLMNHTNKFDDDTADSGSKKVHTTYSLPSQVGLLGDMDKTKTLFKHLLLQMIHYLLLGAVCLNQAIIEA